MHTKSFGQLFLLSFLMLVFLPSLAFAQTIVREIRVKGAERIEPATVASYLSINVGDEMTQQNLDKGLKSLFSTGLFADVTLRQDGDALVVDVQENPIINRIAFEGNDKIKDEELAAEAQLRPRQVFTRTRVQSDVMRLYQIYRRNGHFSVNIEPKVIKLDQNRVDLAFEIDEGDITKVESIRFIGNKRFDDDKLRGEISTKESIWYRFLTGGDNYDQDRLAYDQELLRRYYLSQGYADFQILSAVAELSDERDRFFVTFTLDEGQRYKVGEINIDSQIRNYDASVLNQELVMDKGDWYNADYVRESVDAVTDALGDQQYAFVNVQPDIRPNKETQLVDITFQISETPRVFVERINVNGNIRTLDKVVRRELELVEGDPFNRSKLSRSEQNIRDLDFFETVEVNTSPGSAPDKVNIDVAVAEKSTGEISVGAGFSTSEGPIADFSIRERNFLGKGQEILLATSLGQTTRFNASFTEPRFQGRDFAVGTDLFHVSTDGRDSITYDQTRSGGALRVGYPLSERWRQTLKYSLFRNEISSIDDNANFFLRAQEGKYDTSVVSQGITYDSRDSTLQPTNGLLYWLSTGVSGLGGDSKYVSASTGASQYFPVADGWVFNVLGEVGAIEGYSDANVRVNERFNLGENEVRGFDNAGITPRTTDGDLVGGNKFYRGTAELSFPLYGLSEELGIKGHTFTDIGSAWDSDDEGPSILDESSIRVGVGAGISWNSPFGPLRADLAKAVVKEDFDETQIFHFNFGTRF